MNTGQEKNTVSQVNEYNMSFLPLKASKGLDYLHNVLALFAQHIFAQFLMYIYFFLLELFQNVYIKLELF